MAAIKSELDLAQLKQSWAAILFGTGGTAYGGFIDLLKDWSINLIEGYTETVEDEVEENPMSGG